MTWDMPGGMAMGELHGYGYRLRCPPPGRGNLVRALLSTKLAKRGPEQRRGQSGEAARLGGRWSSSWSWRKVQ